ncbi:MAG: GNAT family N-acetyltransferase [Pseudomonadota bacterium]
MNQISESHMAVGNRHEANPKTFDGEEQAGMQTIQWRLSTFNELSNRDLYALLALRESIFIVEQDVPYSDIDGKDLHCTHLLGSLHGELVAYMRILPVGLFEAGFFSIGRVVLRQDLRSTGIGHELVRQGMQYLDSVRSNFPVKISSQLYLKNFYSRFGFVAVGDMYIEDRIPHIAMVRI